MIKKALVILIAGVFAFSFNGLSFAMMCGGHSQHQQTTQAETEEHAIVEHEIVTESPLEESINVGNKICPVSGDKIGEETKATYEYEGKIYNFCCPMCIEEFKKDPKKYIEKVEAELEAESERLASEEKETVSEPQMPQSLHEGHHH